MDCDDSFGPVASGCRPFDFTLLFEQSILSIAPSVLLLLFAPWRVFLLAKASRKTVPNLLSGTTIAASLALVALQLALIVEWTRFPAPRTAIPAAVLSFCDSLAILALTSTGSRHIRPLSSLTIYLLLSAAFGAVELRTLYLRQESPSILGLSTAILVTKLLILLLELPSKTRWLRVPYRSLSAEATSGVIQRSLFWWLNPLMTSGFRKLLSVDDLYSTDPRLYSEPLEERLNRSWAKYAGSEKQSLVKASLHCFRWELLSIVLPRAFVIGFNYAQPFLISRVVSYVAQSPNENDENDGYGLIAATVLIYLGMAIANVQFQHKLYRALTMFRGGVVSMIYTKSLNVPTGVYDDSAALTLMSTDIDRITNSFDDLSQLWAYVIEIAIGLWLLEQQVGAVCIAPIVVVLSGFYGAVYVAKHVRPAQKSWVEAIQKRVAMISPVLNSMKAVKMMGIGSIISRRLQDYRISELALSARFRRFSSIRIMLTMFPGYAGPFAVFVVFAIQSAVNGTEGIDASKAFTTLAIISLMTSPAGQILQTIPSIGLVQGCLARIETYLKSESWDDERFTTTGHPLALVDSVSSGIELGNIRRALREAIAIDNVTIRPSKDASPAINGLTFTVPCGSLVMITGPVGCGKTTLLRAILGDTKCDSGSITVSRQEMGFCSQNAWLPNGTVRQIITGYKEAANTDEQFYETAVHACAFDIDIAQLAQGHDTEIGTRGVTLSGGQRQRLALARAVYARKEILLLDDVLSALDHDTEQLIIDRLLGERSLSKILGISIVLSGHAWRPMHLADNIIVLNANGTLRDHGRWEDLRERGILNDDFIKTATSLAAETSPGDTKALPSAAKGPSANDIADVRRQTGDVSLYTYYLKTIGAKITTIMGVSVAFCALSQYFPQIWIKWYATGFVNSNSVFSSVYTVLVIIAIISSYSSAWTFYCLGIPRSGARLHEILLRAVFDAPQSFHDKTDAGVTLNRFSQDMTLVDGTLPSSALITLQAAANSIVLIAFVATGSTWMGLAIPILFTALYVLQKVYLRTSRQIRVLDLEAKSPLYSHFVESIEGLPTIRAFGWQTRLATEFRAKLDISQKPYYLMFCIQRWLNLALGLLIGAMAVVVVTLAISVRNSTNAGSLGVALTGILSLDTNFQYLMMAWTMLETSLGAVARTRDFERDTPSEITSEQSTTPPSSWPANANIEFFNLEARYADFSPLALSIPSLRLPASSRIGVIGRTGSGKSTFLSLLTGLLSPSSGNISIDGIPISQIPLSILRERIITIPQESFILAGLTIRENADLSLSVSDEDIISALERVDLWPKLSARYAEGLDALMPTLSAGESQVFALARALLKKRVSGRTGGILLLDEASSNTDAVTDESMSRIIHEEFHGWTVIMVAHRLETVRRICDTGIRLEKGEVVEMGPVADVLRD